MIYDCVRVQFCKRTCKHTVYVCACFCKCLSVSFEHVFTVKSLHVQPHKELIGFSLVSCLTEISWSKLKSVFFTLIKKVYECVASDPCDPWPLNTHTQILKLSVSVIFLTESVIGGSR